MNNKADISTPVNQYLSMAEHWQAINALMKGELEVKASGRKFLPQEPAETNDAYNNRLKRSSLFNAYKATVEAMAGEPFTRPVILTDEPPELEYIQQDADSSGQSLTNFARNLLLNLVTYGKAHILVDYPQIDSEITVAEQNQFNIRPYFVCVNPTSLIGWRSERIGSLDVLQSIRIHTVESEFSADNEWEQTEVEYIRHYTPTMVEVYRKNRKEWELISRVENTLGKIPLVSINGMVSYPPLEDLANLNIKHYQKLSDLDNIEHIANVPILFGSGFSERETQGIQIGPNRLISSTDPQAKLAYVEHSGSAISASQRSIEALEHRMMLLAASILQQRNQNRETATARLIDKGESLSDLQIMVRNLEAGLVQAYNYAGEWIGRDDIMVQIDIGDSLSIPVEANATNDLLNLQTMGVLSSEDLIDELKRRGILSARFKLQPSQYEEGEPTDAVTN